MADPPQNTNGTDFKIPEIVRTVEDHKLALAAVVDRIKVLEDKFGTNEKIAETLCATSATAVKMQTMLSDTFTKLLRTDEGIKNGVTELINKNDRHLAIVAMKRFGFAVYTAIISIIGIVIGAMAKGWFSSSPPH